MFFKVLCRLGMVGWACFWPTLADDWGSGRKHVLHSLVYSWRFIPHFNMAGLEALCAAGAWRTMVPRIQQALLLSAAYSVRRLGRRPASGWRPKNGLNLGFWMFSGGMS